MDIAYNQHSPHSRNHNRSSTNLNRLTLAPLTSRLPLSDTDDLPESQHTSYIEGRSAPTTPSILSRSSSRVSVKKPAHITLPKSKSSTHLLAVGKQPRYTATTPGGTKLRQTVTREELSLSTLSANDRNDSDWLLRAGASITTSARESKGQAWLVSRASSTSLTAQRDDEEMESEHNVAREKEQLSRRGSRRGSATGAFDADDECSPVTTRRSLSFGPASGTHSRPLSRFESRSNSRRGSRAQLYTPLTAEREGYFDHHRENSEELMVEPDFVEVEEENAETLDEIKHDEAIVRSLARANSDGFGGWVERMLGWSLFAVEEDGEEDNDAEDTSDDRPSGSDEPARTKRDSVEQAVDQYIDLPPPQNDETGGWKDAAWLLSVATKVLL